MNRQLAQRISSMLGTLIVTLLLVTMATTSSYAALAGGTVISNTAHVDWAEDGSGTGLDSPPATVTVKLVSGLVWDDTSLLVYTQTVAPGTAITAYTIDLLNLGNGATTVALTDNTTDDANLDGTDVFSAAPTTTSAPHDLTLAGTVSSDLGTFAAGQTTIPVSFIDTGNLIDGETRFHVAGDITTYFTVDTTLTTSTSLVLNGDASGLILNAGVQIGEVVEITYSGTVAGLSSGTSGNHDHALYASDEDAGSGFNIDGNTFGFDTVSSDQDNGAGNNWLTVVAIGDLAINKYVRNTAGTGNPAAAADINYNGVDYWITGVTGDSGDNLEYLIVIENTGVGIATAVVMSDTLSPFIALNGSIAIDTDGDETFNIASAVGASDAATYDVPSQAMVVYAGVGGVASTTTGGDIAAPDPVGPPIVPGQSAIRFQATIQ